MAKKKSNIELNLTRVISTTLLLIVGVLLYARRDLGFDRFYNYLFPFYISFLVFIIFAIVVLFFIAAAWFTNVIQKSDNDRVRTSRTPKYQVIEGNDSVDIKGLLTDNYSHGQIEDAEIDLSWK